MADFLREKISPTMVVGFHSSFGFSFAERLCAVLPCRTRPHHLCFLTGFFFSPRRKPSFLLLSVSLIPHLQLAFKGFGVTLTFQEDKSP